MGTMTQNEVTNALTEAIQTISQSNANAKEATLVVEAEITKVIDAGIGTYKVKYLGNIFEATTAHTEIEYSIGDMVYVIIPNGDFGKNKVILSPVTPSTAVYATTKDKETYITIGDNLFASVADVTLCTYRPHDADPGGTDESPYVNIDITGFNALFKAALNDSRTFNFTCKIRTNIEKERRSKGNYGMILDIPVIQVIDGLPVNTFYSVTVDINNITGDPYNLEVPALQNFYFTLPQDMEFDTNRRPTIRTFVGGFLGVDYTKPDDIFITDIQLLSTMVVDADRMSGYYLNITASEGTSFLASRTADVKTLTATLYLNGNVTNIKDFACYWFKENSAIDNTNEKFQKFGGIGWEILNKVSQKSVSDDGVVSYQYVTNAYTQLVLQSELHCDTRFKCVLVKGETVVSDIITIRNLASTAILELTSLTGSNVYSAGTGSVQLQVKYYELGITDVVNPNFTIGYAWQRLDKEGNYLDNDFYEMTEYNTKINNTFYTKIKYPTSMVDESNTIACTAYIDTPAEDGSFVKRQTIGTVWINIVIGESSNGSIVVENGDKLYKYDADGDSPMVADYDGPLSSALTEIDPISLTLYKEDGKQFTDAEYGVTTVTWLVPVNSMITLANQYKTDTTSNPGYYTIRGNYSLGYSTLSYGIANRYNKNKLDNTILVRAETPAAVMSTVLSTAINLRFLKDGESGTNGTKYSTVLTYGGKGYGEKNVDGRPYKLQLIYVASNQTWYLYNPAYPKNYSKFTSAQLAADLYADGTRVSTGASAAWRIFDSNFNNAADNIVCPININGSTGVITPNGNKWTDTGKNFCATVEARVYAHQTATLASQTHSDEYIYAYYPIECTYITQESYLPSCLPSMEGGFAKVLYASDGTNPQYDNSEDFYVSDYLYGDDISNLYNYEWSTSSNMRPKTTNQSTCAVVPSSKYDNGVAKNYIRVQLTRSAAQTNLVNQKLTEANNQRTQAQNRLNYYKLLNQNLDFFKSFMYNNYIESLTSAASFYKLKTNLVNTSGRLVEQLKIIRDTCLTYLTKDGVEDDKIKTILIEVNPIITKVTELDKLTYELGVKTNSITKVKAITPVSIIITKTIPFTSDGTPNRGCYFSINDAISIYNNMVNAIYKNYYNILVTNTQVPIGENTVRTVMNNLTTFVNDNRLVVLGSSHYGFDEQAYRYTALSHVLKARLESASKQLDTYSYALVLDNIVIPMYKDIYWYIDFYDNGGYTDEINSITQQIATLDIKITALRNMLLPQNSVNVIHVKPIIMLYNRYEFSNINGWDGNKVEVEDGYILAPQMGAGSKNQANQFTGVVMGVKQIGEKNTTNQRIGLFGYSAGIQSFFLNSEDGSALFGMSGKGQIVIDPTQQRGLLYSSNFWNNYDPKTGRPSSYSTSNYSKQGMLIDLTTPEIRYGSGNFVVDKNGNMVAAGNGSVAGWVIDDTTIHSRTGVAQGRIVIDSGAYVKRIDEYGNKIYDVKRAGRIYTGTHDEINSTSNGFYLSENGISFGSKARIDADGVMYLGAGATNGSSKMHWTINGSGSGDGATSYISFNTSAFNRNKNSVYIGTNGISLGVDKFYVDNNGNLVANSGVLGGIVLDSQSIHTSEKNSLSANSAGFYFSNRGTFEVSNGNRSKRLTYYNGNLELIGGEISASVIRGTEIYGSYIEGSEIHGGEDIQFNVDENEINLGRFQVILYDERLEDRQLFEAMDESNGFSTDVGGTTLAHMWAGYEGGGDDYHNYAFLVNGEGVTSIRNLFVYESAQIEGTVNITGEINYNGSSLEEWIISNSTIEDWVIGIAEEYGGGDDDDEEDEP